VEIATRTQADEVMIATHAYEPAARIRSYELLAQAFGLPEAITTESEGITTKEIKNARS
jgi:hypothetical protein